MAPVDPGQTCATSLSSGEDADVPPGGHGLGYRGDLISSPQAWASRLHSHCEPARVARTLSFLGYF